MLACIPCKQAWSLFESGDDDYLFILLWSCNARAAASTAAARSARCAIAVVGGRADMHHADVLAVTLAVPMLTIEVDHHPVCVRLLGAQAAFGKCHSCVRGFGRVFVLP